MIASVLRLSRSDCKVLGIYDDYGIHKAVYSLFPKQDEQTRDFIYADKGGDFNLRQVLILSHRPPEIPTIGQVESKRIPDEFLSHAEYGFILKINPTKREKSTGKNIPIRGNKEQGVSDRQALHDWFVNKAPAWGFIVDTASLEIQEIGVQTIAKGNQELVHGFAIFLGQLKVTAPNLFKSSFQNGIGRAKSFGFGLLQIVPLQSK